MAQINGEVRWFNNLRGYGFLGHAGGADVFCHYTAIQSEGYKTLNAGDLVRFNIEQGEKGAQAALVERVAGMRSELAEEMKRTA